MYLEATKKEEKNDIILTKPPFVETNNSSELDISNKIAAIKLWNTKLSKRAVNVCKRHDWTGRESIRKGLLQEEYFKPLATIGDLCNWERKELLELQSCGKSTVTEFEELLSKYGLALKD